MEEQSTETKSRISLFEKISYGLGDAGCNLVWTTISMFLILYYTDSVGIGAGIVGTIMLVTRLLDGLTDLGMGAIIDRTKTKWGKARPWILWTALPMGIGLVFMFSVPQGLGETGKIVFAFTSYLIMAAVIYTACNLPYNALLSLAAPEQQDRVSMTSIRFFFTLGTVILISNFTMPLVKKLGWSGMSIVFGILAALLLLVTAFFTKERVVEAADAKHEKKPVAHSFKVLMQNKYFVLVSLIFVLNYAALGVANGIAVYYARNILGKVGLIGALVMAFILPKMLGNLIYPQAAKLFGKWKTLMAGYILEIAGLLVILFMPVNLTWVLIGLVIKGIGGVPHTAGLFAMVADVVDYGEWKTGERIDGLTYSSVSFGMKVGTGLGTALVGWVLAFGGYNAKLPVQGPGALEAIKALYIYIPLAMYAVGAVILCFTNLDKIYPTIKKELSERKA